MSRRPPAGRARRADRRSRLGPIVAVVVVTLVALAAFIWLTRPVAEAPSTAAAAGRTLGDPAAPVVVEDWSDFQ